jgi:hypothetical protein
MTRIMWGRAAWWAVPIMFAANLDRVSPAHVNLAAHIAATRADSTGTIVGQLVRKGTTDPVSSATIQMVGTDLGALSDREGWFTIRGAPSGKHELLVRMRGFLPAQFAVTVRVARVDTVRLEMSARSAIRTDEVGRTVRR